MSTVRAEVPAAGASDGAGRRPRSLARGLILLFTVSGAAGIVYEAVWSHYLKLFLGHAAYAQAIVLVIFMGGLALGAWVAAAGTRRLSRLLLAYAAVEAAIGLLALVFHPLYVAITDAALGGLLPALEPPWAVTLAKYGLAAALMLPQSVLLGMTFPWMTVGLQRLQAMPSGMAVATLYFCNSLGAAIGVLATGFVLVPWLGLPGTLTAAGSVNLAIAVVIVLVVRSLPRTPEPDAGSAAAGGTGSGVIRIPGSALLAVALLTGASSFVYEVVWIRMLNLVLGSTTHSFELMLAAFILGLALGGAWIRRVVDGLPDPVRVLALVQIAMGVLAAASLAFYDFSFDLMAAVMVSVARTPFGYVLFLLAGALIALLIMLPTTICAGMTLPLITHALWRRTGDERAVGRIYAANTIGAIAGVVVTVLWLIPLLRLKGALLVGVVIDLGLGVWLLQRHVGAATRHPALVAAAAGSLAALLLAVAIDTAPTKLASGVYRTSRPVLAGAPQVDFQRDGRTASVSVFTVEGSRRLLATNGKPDASMQLDLGRPPTQDEATQVLSGALPLLMKPDARRAAVVGIGSGMTTHALLASPVLEVVDTIEIEAAMIEGASGFLPHVARAFSDPRSRLHVEDARTFLAVQKSPYDLIVSEPSNPWVSGVAGLFTREFYALVKRHLAAGGVFAQWMQLYEIDMPLVAVVFAALESEFDHLEVYEMGDGNLLIGATVGAPPADAAERVLAMGDLQALLARVGIHNAAELRARRVASGASLAPLFASYEPPINSDFHPVLDHGAPLARFRRASAGQLGALVRAPLPVLELVGDRPLRADGIGITQTGAYRTQDSLARAALLDRLAAGETPPAPYALTDVVRQWTFLGAHVPDCSAAAERHRMLSSFLRIGEAALPFLDPAAGARLLDVTARRLCPEDAETAAWLALLRAVAARDAPAMGAAAERLLALAPGPLHEEHARLLAGAALAGGRSRGEVLAHWPAETRAALADFPEVRLFHALGGARAVRPVAAP